MTLFTLAFTFFLIANPIGNIPAIIGLIKNFSFQRQRKIMLREAILAFCVALFFQFAGKRFFEILHVKEYTISIAGGVMLFLVCLDMIFPSHLHVKRESMTKEPFFVPIATPLITGGGFISSILLYSSLLNDPLFVTSALALAFVPITLVMVLSPYVQKILGRRGILALEQFMGMLLSLLSLQLIMNGIILFKESV